MQFHHVGISVSDIDRAIAFYRDMFGMECATEMIPFAGEQFEAIMNLPDVKGRMCLVTNGSLTLELFEFSNPKPGRKDPDYPVSDLGYSHFGIVVDDIEDCYRRLKAAGVPIHSPVMTFMDGGMKAIYARDPDGNVFEVMQPGSPGEARDQ